TRGGAEDGVALAGFESGVLGGADDTPILRRDDEEVLRLDELLVDSRWGQEDVAVLCRAADAAARTRHPAALVVLVKKLDEQVFRARVGRWRAGSRTRATRRSEVRHSSPHSSRVGSAARWSADRSACMRAAAMEGPKGGRSTPASVMKPSISSAG